MAPNKEYQIVYRVCDWVECLQSGQLLMITGIRRIRGQIYIKTSYIDIRDNKFVGLWGGQQDQINPIYKFKRAYKSALAARILYGDKT